MRFLSPLVLLVALLSQWCAAGPVPGPGPWVPIFKGVERSAGTNTPGMPGAFSSLQVAYCIRVDLSDPDVQLFTTPRASSYTAETRETLTRSVPNTLRLNNLQVAVDCNFYRASQGGSDPSSEGLSCEVFGLQISAGTVISTIESSAPEPRFASLLFTTNKQPIFRFRNLPPGTNTTGIYTAVTGYYPIVSNGVNIGAASISSYPDSWIHQTQPRTIFGISQDNRYLLIMCIDGRQGGYSDGALDAEAAAWMLQFGGWNAINMDGGGSTALYIADSAGNPVTVNHSSYLPAYGHERYIGSQFGVYAKPLPGFFNDVIIQPDDTAATITWTTIDPATTQVRYGLTTNFTDTTPLVLTLTTNHAVLLTNLTPNTGYYFAAVGQIGATVFVSSNYFFTTTNYVASTNLLFDLTNWWTFTFTNLDGINWTDRTYDDYGWDGAGPGVLWADKRYVQAGIPQPNTEMPWDVNSGYPFPTYYFRTYFNFTNQPAGVSLMAEAYVDDGAVFYLNGTEIQRMFLAPAPTPIYNVDLAIDYLCHDTGNATCPYDFTVSGPLMTNLVSGTNVLAVEVHNYNPKSPDITFGMSLAATIPYTSSPQLNMVYTNSTLCLSWDRGGFILQQAGSLNGPWTNTPGPVVSSPFTTPVSGAARFYRLKK